MKAYEIPSIWNNCNWSNIKRYTGRAWLNYGCLEPKYKECTVANSTKFRIYTILTTENRFIKKNFFFHIFGTRGRRWCCRLILSRYTVRDWQTFNCVTFYFLCLFHCRKSTCNAFFPPGAENVNYFSFIYLDLYSLTSIYTKLAVFESVYSV